jgi:hypothetical protein
MQAVLALKPAVVIAVGFKHHPQIIPLNVMLWSPRAALTFMIAVAAPALYQEILPSTVVGVHLLQVNLHVY